MSAVDAQEQRLPHGSIPETKLDLPAGTVVITDLHLAPFGNVRSEHFARWCDALTDAPMLCILGDFFDTWFGAKQARVEGTKHVLDALKRLAARGTNVHVVPGNRDALMDEAFERSSGATVHLEGFVAANDGGLVFVHGDSLCTLDVGYQRLRKVWRNRTVRWISVHAPLWFARSVGRNLRRESESRKPYKPSAQKSIRPAAARVLADAVGAGTVICGHAHEAFDRAAEADGDPRRIVLGAWGTPGDVLRIDANGSIAFDPAAAPVGT